MLDSGKRPPPPRAGNLYSYRVISHKLIKWTDHPLGICGRGAIKLALTGIGIGMRVSLGLAPYMFCILQIWMLGKYWIKKSRGAIVLGRPSIKDRRKA